MQGHVLCPKPPRNYAQLCTSRNSAHAHARTREKELPPRRPPPRCSGPSLTSAASSSLALHGPPISSSPHRPPPRCSGQPPCLAAPLALAVSARPRLRRPTAALPGIPRDCQGNHNHKERCGVLRRCKRKGPLTPGTATAAPGAETRSPEHPHAARASTYSSCHSTEHYHLPQQSTLLAAFMCYACYATDMTWSYRINKECSPVQPGRCRQLITVSLPAPKGNAKKSVDTTRKT